MLSLMSLAYMGKREEKETEKRMKRSLMYSLLFSRFRFLFSSLSVAGQEGESLVYDADTQSVIKLNNGLVLYLREVNRYEKRKRNKTIRSSSSSLSFLSSFLLISYLALVA